MARGQPVGAVPGIQPPGQRELPQVSLAVDRLGLEGAIAIARGAKIGPCVARLESKLESWSLTGAEVSVTSNDLKAELPTLPLSTKQGRGARGGRGGIC